MPACRQAGITRIASMKIVHRTSISYSLFLISYSLLLKWITRLHLCIFEFYQIVYKFILVPISVSATSDFLIFPSSADIFNCLLFTDSSLPSFFSLAFKSLQYLRGRSVPESTSITSMIEKHRFQLLKDVLPAYSSFSSLMP